MPFRAVCVWAGASASPSTHRKSFGGTAAAETDPTVVDGEELAKRVVAACSQLETDGYEVISILPLTRGSHSSPEPSVYGSVAWTPTMGALVVGRTPVAR